MNRFTPEELAAGESLLKAFAVVHNFSDAAHAQQAVGLRSELGEIRLEVVEATPGEFSPRLIATPQPELAATAFANGASLSLLATAANENLQTYLKRFNGRTAHFFPKEADGLIATESRGESPFAYERRVVGQIIEQEPFSPTALMLKVKHFAGRSTTEKVFMGGGCVRYVGACTASRLAIV